MTVWMSAEEALMRLGTKPQTLYANVSRGRIRARPDPGDPRRSQYYGEDVQRLAARRPGRRSSDAVAAETIRWGEPILPTALSTVKAGRLLYRGQDAVLLSEERSLEDIAALLWGCDGPERAPSGESQAQAGLSTAFSMLAARVTEDLPTLGRSPAALRRESLSVLSTVAAALAPGRDAPLHLRLAHGWKRPGSADILRRALVLLAEHELNASTFAARVAASTGAPLSACVLAGLSALAGPRHGAAWESAAALAESARLVGPKEALRRALVGEGALRGFGHPLYPEGDVRAAALLSAVTVPPDFAELAAAGEAVTGEAPNVDFALTAITAAFDLPAQAPLLLFALARTVGWLAHALEQAETGELIRPRAVYVGS